MKVPIGTKIYIRFGRRLLIPVNPEELNIRHPSQNERYHVLGKGEIVVPRAPGLTEVSWESYFPAETDDPFTQGGTSAKSLVQAIKKAKKAGRIGRLVITRAGLLDTNLRCIIEDFETIDKGGEPDDIYYSITLLEYRSYEASTVVIAQPATEEAPAQAVEEAERPVETPVLRVGAQVVANGKYWYDSYGSKPYGTANNLSTTVTRIHDGNEYPVHIGHYGWLKADQLQIVG